MDAAAARLLALSAAIAAAAGFAAALFAGRLADPAPDAGPRALPSDRAEDLARVDERLAAVEGALRDLDGRLAALELVREPERREEIGGTVDRDELEAAVEAFLAERGAETPPVEPAPLQPDAVLDPKGKLDALVGRPKAAPADLDTIVTKYESWLELTPHQREAVRGVLVANDARASELERLFEEGADPEFLGQRKQEDRDALMAEMQAVLTPEQFARYAQAQRAITSATKGY